MGIFENGFDATTETEGVEKSDFTPFPAGNYTLIVDECAETQSKAGNDMLRIALSVSGGDHDGRKLWDYIVPGASPYAVAKLKNLSLSAGLNSLTCAEDLLGHTVRAKIKVDPAKGEYSASNKVGDYIPKTPGLEQQQAAPAPQAAAVPPRAAASTGWDS